MIFSYSFVSVDTATRLPVPHNLQTHTCHHDTEITSKNKKRKLKCLFGLVFIVGRTTPEDTYEVNGIYVNVA